MVKFGRGGKPPLVKIKTRARYNLAEKDTHRTEDSNQLGGKVISKWHIILRQRNRVKDWNEIGILASKVINVV
jgi:hypothetical protein